MLDVKVIPIHNLYRITSLQEPVSYTKCICFASSTECTNSAAIEELKKQIVDIVQELNLLKEKQALQTGICFANHKYHTITLFISAPKSE